MSILSPDYSNGVASKKPSASRYVYHRIIYKQTLPIMSSATQRNLLFLIFTLSGFSGLIYESIWTHYLKLFLGHAAFAQVLVLGIFMGGMAIGAWLTARLSKRWRNLLLIYAIAEGVVGFLAIAFHPVFVSVIDAAYSLFGVIESPSVIGLLKWTLAAALILPQSILLGMTFPLMSGGIIRLFPQNPGRTLSILYFTNSLGAAIGVLVSGFVLIGFVGLPGTVFTAGLINVLLALVVWAISKTVEDTPVAPVQTQERPAGDRTVYYLLLLAFITGAASFMYEIGWIRMLSLVLGASTHAFELMLSAFILGLALGGWWIRKRIDQLQSPVVFLGWVQIAMALLALATIPFYQFTFEIMGATVQGLQRNDTGYLIFNFASHLITLLVMLPATICAGMTLPLITHILLKNTGKEQAIGQVYASNTAGAISGLIIAVNIGLPLLGLKYLITMGAMLDALAGILLLAWVSTKVQSRQVSAATAVAGVAMVLVVFSGNFDTSRLVSGVYRFGFSSLPESHDIEYYRDGKTASVSIVRAGDNELSIRTNGKSDASIQMTPGGRPTLDEPTMIMLAAIPMALHPGARNVANIGIGSGLSSHTLLANPQLERVDTIEIEPLMVEAAEAFGVEVERVYKDPRSFIHIDDAKSFFTYSPHEYDIVISEPSNPWVSGISGLFTQEFYELVNRHIAEQGIFVQWIHLYETNVNIVSSVFKALGSVFGDYQVFTSNGTDLIIVAGKTQVSAEPDQRVFDWPQLKTMLGDLGIHSVSDMVAARVGNKALLHEYWKQRPVPINSDYYPFLDQNAVRARFYNKDAFALKGLRISPLPFAQLLPELELSDAHLENVAFALHSPTAIERHVALTLLQSFLSSAKPLTKAPVNIPPDLKRSLMLLQSMSNQCNGFDESTWLQLMLEVNRFLVPHLTQDEYKLFWAQLRKGQCYEQIYGKMPLWLDLMQGLGTKTHRAIINSAVRLLTDKRYNQDPYLHGFLLSSSMLAWYSLAQMEKVLGLWQQYGNGREIHETFELPVDVLRSLALSKLST